MTDAIKRRMVQITTRTEDGGLAVRTADHGTLRFPADCKHIAAAVAQIEAERFL